MEIIDLYDAADATSVEDAVAVATRALDAVNAPVDDDQDGAVPAEILEDERLIGVDPSVYRQVETAINAGKNHIMFYGPPGTGKTELARYVADSICTDGYTLVTGSADWTSQDLIGGYQPIGAGEIAFIPGVLLRYFDRPLIIDELNRCDIDKVLGPLFTVLSKQSTTLPYRVDVKDPKSAQYQILGQYDASVVEPDYAPTRDWRIIATINTVDKASLYQMSYALSRRFAWVFVDVPSDRNAFVGRYLDERHQVKISSSDILPLAAVWNATTEVRPLGAAPFIDVINYCLTRDEEFDFEAVPAGDASEAYLDAFKVNVLPMLDGVLKDEMQALSTKIADILKLNADETSALARQMLSIGL
jgi:5-methylcytosine-specific restriction protein B